MRLTTIAALLLGLFARVLAADVEKITLDDGRQLIGVYDESAGVINLHGPGAVAVRVKPSQIKTREVVTVKDDEAPKDQTKVEAKPQEQPEATLESARKQAKKLRDEATKIEFDAIVRWMQKETATAIEKPTPKEDPKKSEQEAFDKEMNRYNRQMKLRSILKESKAAETPDEQTQIILQVDSLMSQDARHLERNSKRR